MSIVRRSSCSAVSLAAAALMTTVALTGCAVGTLSSSTAADPIVKAGVTITGRVMGGQQPIGGATINIYQTGNTGYGSGSTLIATTQSTAVNNSALGVAGNFSVTIPAVTCPTNNSTYAPAFYATASGGDATGATPSNVNPAILLVSMFDTCATGTASYVAINELTTVAAAYALRSFTTDAGGTVSIGTPTTNNLGFNDALANANLLVNAQTGKAKASTAAVTLPTNMLNTLADVLAYCVNQSAQPTPSTAFCGNLFAATTPPTGAASTAAPTDTFQAALNMAQFPASNVQTLLGYVGGGGTPYTPSLGNASSTSVINDLTLGIAFHNANEAVFASSPDGIAIDSNDNVFTIGAYGSASTVGASNSAGNSLAAIGEVYSPSNSMAGTYTSINLPGKVASPQQGAFDLNNNLFLSDSSNGVVLELPAESVTGATPIFLTSPDGTTPSDTGTANGADIAQNTWGISIDSGNNVFTASYRSAGNCKNSVVTPIAANSLCQFEELPSGSTTFNATPGSATTYTSTSRATASDANINTSTYKGNAWASDYNDNNVHILNLNATDGTTVGNSVSIPVGTTATNVQYGLALDASSNAWVVGYTAGTLTKVFASDVSGATTPNVSANPVSPSTIMSSSSALASMGTAYPFGGFKTPRYNAIDGAGNVFVANGGNSAIIEYSPSFNSGAGAFLSPYYGFSPSLTQGMLGIGYYKIAAAGGTLTLTTSNNLIVGQTVTLSGFTNATCLNGQTVTVATRAAYQFTVAAAPSGCAAQTTFMADNGIGTVSAPNPALFTCTTTCSITGNFSTTYVVAIDKAGSVWEITNGASAVELLGLGAPTNPVLAGGQYGVKP